MGIRGLNTCINRTIPEYVKPVQWKIMRKTRIGIDINCFLYRALANHIMPIKIIAEQIAKFKKLGITPIYVFDGKPPSEKDIVVTKRKSDRKTALELKETLYQLLDSETDIQNRETLLNQIHDLESANPVLTYETRDEIKQFLYATGTMFVSAMAEADSLLAYFYKRGIIDCVASFDIDFLPRGSILIIPKSINEPPGANWSYYDPVTIRRGLKLSESDFVDFCVLLGSDYTPNLTIVPWKIALQSLQNREGINSIWARHTFSNWRRSDSNKDMSQDMDQIIKARAILMGTDETPEKLMDPIQWLKWGSICAKEPSVLKEFMLKYSDWPNDLWDGII
jgi:flap endonuclease-1